MRAIDEGTHEKFDKLAEGVRAIEEGTHDVHSHVDLVMRENCARENAQLATNKQLKSIQEALARFMETCDPAHPTPVCTFVQQRAQNEHANHTVGSPDKIPLGIFLRVPCESDRTSRAHARKRRLRPQSTTNARGRK